MQINIIWQLDQVESNKFIKIQTHFITLRVNHNIIFFDLMLEQTRNLTNYIYRYVLTSLSSPTQEQIDQAIKAISKKFPKHDLFNIVSSLYRKVEEVKSKQLKKESMPTIAISQAKCFDYNNFVKKMVAKSFYYCGYGYQKFIHFAIKQHASFHIDKNKYNIFCEGMVLQVYRSLQKMMIRNGQKIKLKHKDMVKKLNQWVLNDRIHLSEDQRILLRGFISKRYQIKDNVFTIVQARTLYELLQKRYKTSISKQNQKIDQFLNSIQLSSNNDTPSFNLDQLLKSNQITHQSNYKVTSISPQLHYQNCNSDQLNFDIYFDQCNQF